MYSENELEAYNAICDSDGYRSYLTDLYSDVPEETIHFIDKGSIAEDGSFQIQLTEDSKKYVKSVCFYLIEFDNGEEGSMRMQINGLGVDDDIYKNWDDMSFHSNFRGIWLGLDGELLSYSIVESNDERIIFSAPVIVNGRTSNLRFSFIWDDSYENGGYYQLIGLWDGISEDGVVDKDITPLKEGDEVTILARQIDVGDYLSSLTEKATITIGSDGGVISEIPLSEDYYQYVYAVTDIFGNVFYSSTAVFEMQYTYEELLNNPLPDGTYAAKVSVISEDVDNELAYGGGEK